MSVSPAPSLFNIPKDTFNIIVSYCQIPEILELEQTHKYTRELIKDIWLKLMIERNLFVGISHDENHDISFHGFCRLERRIKPTSTQSLIPTSIGAVTQNDRKFLQNPKDYLHISDLSDIEKNKIFNKNKSILQILLTRIRGLPQQLMYNQTKNVQARLTESVLCKRLYLQIIEQERDVQITNPIKISSVNAFSASAFVMLDQALKRDQKELFSLLNEYRFGLINPGKKDAKKFARGYIRQCNFLIFNEIQHVNSYALTYFLNALANQPTLIPLNNLFDKKNTSVSQEEDKKMSEEETKYHTSALNLKFSEEAFSDWPIHIPTSFQNRTPLEYAIAFAHYTSTTFMNENHRRLNPKDNPNLDVVKVLIDAKADVNEPGLVYHMIRRVYDLDIFTILITNGAKVNQLNEGHTLLGTAVIQLGRPENLHPCLKVLLRAKANVNGRDVNGCTPLMLASESSTPETVKFLLDHGADRSAYDHRGDTPLSYTLKTRGNIGKVKILLASRVASSHGAKKRIVRMSKEDINRVNVDGHTALSKAIMDENPGTASYIKLLIAAGADPRLLPENLRVPGYLLQLLYPETQTKGVKRKNQD